MFINKVVLCLVIVNTNAVARDDYRFLKKCVESIQEEYFEPEFWTFFMNFHPGLQDLHLSRPVVVQDISMAITPSHYVKADGYIITIPQNSSETIFGKLVMSYRWNPRGRFILVVDALEGLFAILNKYYVFNVAAVVISEDEQKIYTYFPYDFSAPENQRTKAIQLNVCIQGELQQNTNLFPWKLPQEWSNVTARVSLLEYPPYVICSQCQEKRGIEMKVFNMVQKMLGFKVDFVNKTYANWGHRLDNGTFTEIYGDLQSYRSDIGIGVFFPNFTENWYFDLSFPYMEDSFTWVVPASKRLPQWMGLISIYGPVMWISIVSILVLTGFFLRVASTSMEESAYQTIGNCWLISLQCLLGQFVKKPKRAATRLIFTAWVVFTWLITSAYQTHFMAALNFNSYGKQISNVRELIDSGIGFGFYGLAGSLFYDSPDENDNYIINNFSPCVIGPACLDRVAFGGDFATLKMRRYLEYMTLQYFLDDNGRPLIYIFKNQVCHFLVVMAFSKGFPLYQPFNLLLMNIKSTGYIDNIYDKMNNFRKRKASQAQKRKKTKSRLKFKELRGVFYLLIAGWLLSTLSFIMEVNQNRCTNIFKKTFNAVQRTNN